MQPLPGYYQIAVTGLESCLAVGIEVIHLDKSARSTGFSNNSVVPFWKSISCFRRGRYEVIPVCVLKVANPLLEETSDALLI